MNTESRRIPFRPLLAWEQSNNTTWVEIQDLQVFLREPDPAPACIVDSHTQFVSVYYLTAWMHNIILYKG